MPVANIAFVRSLLGEQRKRLVGSILRYAEDNLDGKMDAEEWSDFREKVLLSVGAYHDTVLDILKSSVDDGSYVVNEEALHLLTQIHSWVKPHA